VIMANPVFDGITSEVGMPGQVIDDVQMKSNLADKGFHRFEGNVFMMAVSGTEKIQIASVRAGF